MYRHNGDKIPHIKILFRSTICKLVVIFMPQLFALVQKYMYYWLFIAFCMLQRWGIMYGLFQFRITFISVIHHSYKFVISKLFLDFLKVCMDKCVCRYMLNYILHCYLYLHISEWPKHGVDRSSCWCALVRTF